MIESPAPNRTTLPHLTVPNQQPGRGYHNFCPDKQVVVVVVERSKKRRKRK